MPAISGPASSSTQWKLLPPNPKALTAARRGWPGLLKPGPCFGAEVKRRSPRGQGFDRLAHLDRRRQDLVVERQRGLDQTGRARGRLGVADLRLDRTQSAPRASRPGPLIHLLKGFQLDRVTHLRARAVRFHQLDRIGRDPGQVIRLAQRLDLSRGAGGVNRLALAVARSSHRPDHRVDPVAVPPRVSQTLENENSEPLAQNRAVGSGVKRPRVAGGQKEPASC